MTTKQYREKFYKVAESYLKRLDYRVIYSNFLDEEIIIAQNDGYIVLVDIFESYDEEEPMSREHFEEVIHKFFAQEHEIINVPIRYDIISFDVIANDRAIIRHLVNAELKEE